MVTLRGISLGVSNVKLSHLILICAFVFYGSNAVSKDELVFEEINLPVGSNAFEPSIFATQNNQLIMSWMEEDKGLVSINAAVFNNGKWSEPSQVSASRDIYVNWADSVDMDWIIELDSFIIKSKGQII